LLPNNNDLWLLRLFNKKIIFVMAHGSEMRPPYINGAYQSKDGNIQPNSKFLKKLSFKIKKKILKNEKYSDYIIGAPFSSTQFATKKIINSFLVGIPYIKNKKNDTNKSMTNSLRILHCPSHPSGKGSHKIQTIINKLKKRGHIFDFILLTNRPHHEVLTEIKKCDFIIDQIYSDTPLAGFAMEAALFKKPAIVGGYKLNELKKYFPNTPYPPSYICHPNDLEKGIEKLILNKDFRINLGKIANKFINDYFSADKVANNFLRIINDDIPNSWWIDPNDVTYLEGTAQSIEQTKINIQKLVNKYGKESLQLSHRPKLEKAFLKFAEINEI
jgi:hypothetical protein